MPAVCAVHLCGIVKLCWNSLQACQHDEHSISDPPDTHDDVGRINPVYVVCPGRHAVSRDTQEDEGPVNPAAFRVEHTAPQEDRCHKGNNVRHVKHTAKEHLSFEVFVI